MFIVDDFFVILTLNGRLNNCFLYVGLIFADCYNNITFTTITTSNNNNNNNNINNSYYSYYYCDIKLCYK